MSPIASTLLLPVDRTNTGKETNENIMSQCPKPSKQYSEHEIHKTLYLRYPKRIREKMSTNHKYITKECPMSREIPRPVSSTVHLFPLLIRAYNV